MIGIEPMPLAVIDIDYVFAANNHFDSYISIINNINGYNHIQVYKRNNT